MSTALEKGGHRCKDPIVLIKDFRTVCGESRHFSSGRDRSFGRSDSSNSPSPAQSEQHANGTSPTGTPAAAAYHQPISMETSAANLSSQQHFLQPPCFFPHNVRLSPAEEQEAVKPKPIKRQRSSSPELMRCKRRLNFNGFGYSLPQQQPAAVARRNERERNRVKLVNLGFATLREHVPNGAANKKMSKVETLRSAVEYIRALQQLLDEHDAVSAAFQSGVFSPNISPNYSHGMNSMAGSPVSSYSSDEGSYDPLSPEEQELLDFTTWF
ncbi:hypothetical protein XELAEV_18021297mg [Xenopus laevis]|uniref:BHLH domain-containing protein n=2 Tax=Xenopus laevis TaxID=8355 RepID=A0A974DB14_XENLA|nr:hypothetical protein XELAEV_18021297mg [Xenopus laevis]